MRLSGSDLRLLVVYDAVVRHGGLAAAQTELNIHTSTISNHISALEARLGCTLCQRGRGGFQVTRQGSVVHAEAQRLLSSMDAFSEVMQGLQGRHIGSLRVGTVDAVYTDPQSKLSEAFRRFFVTPNAIRLELAQFPPQELLQRLYDGLIDIGIGSFPNKINGLEYEMLYVEEHFIYCSVSHPLAKQGKATLTMAEVSEYDVVGRGYWRDRKHMQIGLRDIKAVVYEIEPQLILIRSGRFVGFLPQHFAAPWVATGDLVLLPVEGTPYQCTFDLVTRKEALENPLSKRFHKVLLQEYRGGDSDVFSTHSLISAGVHDALGDADSLD